MSSKPLSYGHHQKWRTHTPNSGLATVADSAGDMFMSGNGPREPPRGNMYKPSHYSITPMLGPAHSDDQLRAQEIGLKIKELKRLVIKYQEYLQNPDGIIKWAIHCSNKGDTKVLDEKVGTASHHGGISEFPVEDSKYHYVSSTPILANEDRVCSVTRILFMHLSIYGRLK
jgi:hypothetical protein